MEPDRPPDVQPDQRQLSRRATGQLRENAQAHTPDAVDHRIPLPGGLGYAGVPHRVEGEAGRQGLDPAQASLGLAGLELLHLAPSSSSRLLK